MLLAVLISSANAIIRKTFNVSSNAYLEVQWYLFAAIFLLCAGYVLLHNEHVRIDVLSSRLSKRAQTIIDIERKRFLESSDGRLDGISFPERSDAVDAPLRESLCRRVEQCHWWLRAVRAWNNCPRPALRCVSSDLRECAGWQNADNQHQRKQPCGGAV